MDELGFNKIAGAVLATALGVMMIREVPHLVMHSSVPDTPVYQVGPIVQEGGSGEEEPLPFPQADWVAAMDATAGAKAFKKCTSCHNADNGGTNSTGPNLWNIVGAKSGARGDFKYSSAMSSAELTWDYETLDAFIAKPTKYLKGTNMNFIGEKKADKRAAIIEYLRVAADTPSPKPAVAAMEKSEPVMVKGDSMEIIEGAEIEDGVEVDSVEVKDAMELKDNMSEKEMSGPAIEGAKKLQDAEKMQDAKKMDDGH